MDIRPGWLLSTYNLGGGRGGGGDAGQHSKKNKKTSAFRITENVPF